MVCKDCGEIIFEFERTNGRTCSGCKSMMHSECSIIDRETGEEHCEPCSLLATATYDAAMAAMDAEIGDIIWTVDGEWFVYDVNDGEVHGPFSNRARALKHIKIEAEA